jgi:NAD(P)H dehydrogenase (quinone)
MENAAWDVTAARDTGVIQSFLQPLDKAIPMVATTDVSRVAAELLQDVWQGRPVVDWRGHVAFPATTSRPVSRTC